MLKSGMKAFSRLPRYHKQDSFQFYALADLSPEDEFGCKPSVRIHL